MKILITSGGTDVPIDDVRKITNMSTGRFGAEIAKSVMDYNPFGMNLTYFISKGGHIPKIEPDIIHQNSSYMFVKTYSDYNEYLNIIDIVGHGKPDISISAAAVSDYILDKTEGKISSSDEYLVIRLKKAKKVLPEFKKVSPKSMVVGFKLLVSPTYQEVHKAVQKVLNNGADYVVYNDLTELRKGNSSRLVFSKNMNFREVKDAKELVDYIINEYSSRIDR